MQQLQRNLLVNGCYDVIVAGGGPAGCAAAIAAASSGAKTLLIEATEMLGGAATASLVPAWCPFSDGIRNIHNGIAQHVLELSKAQMPHIDPSALNWVPIAPEALKLIYDDLMAQYGVTVLFRSMICHVETKGEVVKQIIVANKAGLSSYHAGVYVDCTGDGDLCYWAGNSYWKGDEAGNLQSATHCFEITNIDPYWVMDSAQQWSLDVAPNRFPLSTIVKDSETGIEDMFLNAKPIGPTTLGFNAGHVWNVDGTDPMQVSRGAMRGRQLASAYMAAFKKYFPAAFANAYLVETAPLLGIRETRRIEGDYVLTVADYQNRRSFSDEIARNCYYLDLHGTSIAEKSGLQHLQARYRVGESHGIPYRCLTPSHLSNVLMAGRCISADRLVSGSVRVMPTSLSTGEAAGIAAVMAVKMDVIDVHRVNVTKLRRCLQDNGAYLPVHRDLA